MLRSPSRITRDERALLARFEQVTLAPDDLDHETHVKLAWLYLRQDPLIEALARFRAALLRFVAAHGQASRYHETITGAYMLLINERMERQGRDRPWEQFAAENRDVLAGGKRVLAAYYRPETLASDLARRSFLLPDRVSGERP